MREFDNPSYHRASKHRGEHGNLSCDPLEVVIPARAVAGDTIRIDTGPSEHIYVDMCVAREAGLTAGLLIDVGYRDCGQSGYERPQFFAADLAMDAAGKDDLLPTVPKIARGPGDANGNPGRRLSHDLIITLKGTVTPGEKFWVISKMIADGAPAG